MKVLGFLSLASIFAAMLLAPSDVFAQAHVRCGLSEARIVGVSHGDWNNGSVDDVILVIKIEDGDGSIKYVTTQGAQNLRADERTLTLQSMAISAMLSKARVRFLFTACQSSGGRYTNLYGMEMVGG